jgi:hypothetical protein
LIEPKKSIKNIKNEHKQLLTFQKIQKNILEKIKMGFSKNSNYLDLFPALRLQDGHSRFTPVW